MAEPKIIEFAGGSFSIEHNAKSNSYTYKLISFNHSNIDIFDVLRVFENIHALIPYIEAELKDHIRDYRGITLEQVLLNTDADAKAHIFAQDPFRAEAAALINAMDALKRDNKKKRAAEARAKQKEDAEKLQGAIPQKKYIKSSDNSFVYPTTKLSNEFFSYEPPASEIDGQLCMSLPYIDDPKGIALLCHYTYNYDELALWGIEKPQGTKSLFDDYDYFINAICNNLFLEGNTKVSYTKLLHELGIEASSKNIAELEKRLHKGMATMIHINNKELLEAYNINTENYKQIDSPILPITIEKEVSRARGNVMKQEINIYYQSPFFRVAEPINQYTRLDKRMLQLYDGKKNKKYWIVMRYLSKEITWMRNENSTRLPKISMHVLYELCNDNRTESRKATDKLTCDLLDKVFMHKDLKYIKGYELKKDKRGNIIEINLKVNKAKKGIKA